MKRTGLALVLAAALVPLGTRGEGPVSDYEVKAAYLYNFARLVEWPAESLPPGAPFVVALLGEDPFGGVLEQTLAGKSVNGHPVVVRHLDDAGATPRPHILFIAASEARDLGRILGALQKFPVLTVAETEGWAQRGVIVDFVVRQRRVRFEINLPRAEQAGLKISSQILQLATLVEPRR